MKYFLLLFFLLCVIYLELQTTAEHTFGYDHTHRDAATTSVGIGFNWY